MSKKVSFEEKRKRLLEIFYERQEFFQLKELEKIAPKSKGIVLQAVKEVLQSLVDDDLVDTEKIGTSIYFWAFPSKALHTRKRKIEDLRTDIDKHRKLISEMKVQIEKEKKGREETNERETLLQQLDQLEKQRSAFNHELDQYKECDPVILEAKKKATKDSLSAANRWTDNIFSIQSYCSNKFSIHREDFSKQFSLPAEFDYIEG